MLYLLLQAFLVAIVGCFFISTVAVSILIVRLVSHDLEELIQRRRISAGQRARVLRNLNRP